MAAGMLALAGERMTKVDTAACGWTTTTTVEERFLKYPRFGLVTLMLTWAARRQPVIPAKAGIQCFQDQSWVSFSCSRSCS